MLPHYFFLGSSGPSITEREPCCIQRARLRLLWKVGTCSFTLWTRALDSSTLLSEEGISPQQSVWTAPLSYVVLADHDPPELTATQHLCKAHGM